MRRRRSLWPSTALGGFAVTLTALAIVWVFFGRVVQASIRHVVGPGGLGTTGREYVALAIMLGALAFALGLVAMVRRGERSLLVWLTMVRALLLAAFWLIFGAAEVLSPH